MSNDQEIVARLDQSGWSNSTRPNFKSDSNITQVVIQKVPKPPNLFIGVPDNLTLIVLHQAKDAIFENAVTNVVKSPYRCTIWPALLPEYFPTVGIKSELH